MLTFGEKYINKLLTNFKSLYHHFISKIYLEYVLFWGEIYLILYPSLQNLTTDKDIESSEEEKIGIISRIAYKWHQFSDHSTHG